MSIALAEMIVSILALYFAIGLLVALVFVFLGVSRIDPGAKDMPLQARLIILPGVAGLWPLMLTKLLTQKEPPIS